MCSFKAENMSIFLHVLPLSKISAICPNVTHGKHRVMIAAKRYIDLHSQQKNSFGIR